MAELAGGNLAEGLADAYPLKQEPKVVEITPREVERILGISVEAERLVEILESLEFDCEREGETIRAKVPYYRLDVSIPADLIEEVARIIGYDKLPATLLSDELPPQRRNLALEGEEWVRDVLVGCGLQEVITYSLIAQDEADKLVPGGSAFKPEEARAGYPISCTLYPQSCVRLANPMTPAHDTMRTSLMTGLLVTMRDNLRYVDKVVIFEIGRVYLPRLPLPDCREELLPQEPRRLAIAMTGPRLMRSWLKEEPGELDFFDLKGVVETLLARLGIFDYAFEPIHHPTFHPGRTARLVVDGREIGVLGEVHPLVREAFDLPPKRVSLAEFELDSLLEEARFVRSLQPIPRFPSVVQDLAVVVDEDVPAQRVKEVILKAGGELLRNAELFDLYRGRPIPEGKKSLAYSLTYQALDRTLTDEEVRVVHRRIIERLSEELGAELRA
jgi:phenylalanyl-tRNA synthetase beta chain